MEQDMHLSLQTSLKDALDQAATTVRLFVGGNVLTKDLDEKERGPVDELIPLAVASLIGVTLDIIAVMACSCFCHTEQTSDLPVSAPSILGIASHSQLN